jgi:hypothetical protein
MHVEVSGDRVSGGNATGDRNARPKWEMRPSDGKFEDYESFFRAFADKILNNQGSFKVDGSLLFEFVPKAYIRSEKLISPETSFYFHRMAEGVVYANKVTENKPKDNAPALESYNYQKKVPPLDIGTMDEFMPMI